MSLHRLPKDRLNTSMKRSAARTGKAENLIKLSKIQLASARTLCRSAGDNLIRLILHAAAY